MNGYHNSKKKANILINNNSTRRENMDLSEGSLHIEDDVRGSPPSTTENKLVSAKMGVSCDTSLDIRN